MEPSQDGDGYWHDLPTTTTVEDGWAVLALDNRMRILTFGEECHAGGYVHVIRPDCTEVAMWTNEEWEKEGESERVMGAMLRAAAGVRV